MAEATAKASGLAGRYATALFELAREQNAVDRLADDLQSLRSLYAESADFRRLVSSPLFSRDQQRKVIAIIAERAGAAELTRRFLGLLARQGRLFALPGVIDAFAALLASYRGEVSAELISAVPLSDEQVGKLKEQLSETVGKSISLSTSIDPDLLGGIVVRVGSRMIDASLRTKLHRLELIMKGAA